MAPADEENAVDPRLATALQELSGVVRPAGRRGRGRAAVIAAANAAPPAPRRFWPQRLLVGVAGVAAVIAVISVLSHDALPDAPLYSVRRALEGARVSLTFGADSRGHLELNLASERVSEAEAMAQRHRGDLAVRAVSDVGDDVAAASRDFGASATEAQTAAIVGTVKEALPRLESIAVMLASGGDRASADLIRSNAATIGRTGSPPPAPTPAVRPSPTVSPSASPCTSTAPASPSPSVSARPPSPSSSAPATPSWSPSGGASTAVPSRTAPPPSPTSSPSQGPSPSAGTGCRGG
ncbi:MAG: DUF5667 domain-containing protein [Candidatus Dormibacteria bacterium]